MKQNKIKNIILVIAIITAIASLITIIANEKAEKKEKTEKFINSIMANTEKVVLNDNEVVEVEEIKPDYSSFISQNEEFVGYIKVPGTNVDYPVAQAEDNDYYLKHNFDKEEYWKGAVFMDYRNDPKNLDSNTIIYSHNSYDGTMFSDLDKYQDIEFYKEHPVIEFNTTEQSMKWKISAVFITNANGKDDNGYVFNYIYPYMNGENFDGYKEEINARTLYTTDVDIKEDDKILTLSTCTRALDLYNGNVRTKRTNARIVIVARLVRPEESAEVNVENSVINENPKYPQIWYDKYGKTNPYKNDTKWQPIELSKK